jgi:hypothetical protein
LWSKVRHSFSISKFEPVWIIWEYIKTAGAHPSSARSEPRADRFRTAPTTSVNGHYHLARAHDTTVATLPPTFSAASATASCGYKGSAPPTSSPFSSSSFGHALPLLLLAPCRSRPSRPGPSSAASSGHPLPTVAPRSTPRRCTSTTLPAPASKTPLTPHHRSSLLDACHHGQPTLASLRPSRPQPEHHATEYDLPTPRVTDHHPRTSPPPLFPSGQPHLTVELIHR